MPDKMTLQRGRLEVIQIIGRVLALLESPTQCETFHTRPDNCAVTDEIIDSACALRRRIAEADKSPHTIKNWISKLRGQFERVLQAQNYGLDAVTVRRMVLTFNGALVVPDHVAKQVEARASQRRDERAIECVEIEFAECERIVNALSELVQQLPVPGSSFQRDDFIASKLAVYMGLVTGRRPIEWRLDNFHVNPDHKPAQIGPRLMNFSGQAKTRKDEKPLPYLIPVLDDAPHVFQALVSLEAYGIRRFGRGHYDAVAKRIGWPLDKIELMPNTMRSFYACVCAYKFKPGYQQDWQYIGNILGHTPDDMATCQTYKRFAIA